MLDKKRPLGVFCYSFILHVRYGEEIQTSLYGRSGKRGSKIQCVEEMLEYLYVLQYLYKESLHSLLFDLFSYAVYLHENCRFPGKYFDLHLNLFFISKNSDEDTPMHFRKGIHRSIY